MVEIKPSAALNKAVAEAIGLEAFVDEDSLMCLVVPRQWDEIRGIEHPTCEGDVACQRFRPSSDLNDAFAAANVAGLFASFWTTVGADELGEGWGVYDQDGNVKAVVAEAPTPALAICAAILKIKEDQR
jgi:hypothetical protein